MASKGITRATRKGCPNHPIDLKRRLAALACRPETSVAKLALAHGLNANLLFKWRRQYRAGKFGALTGDSLITDARPTLLPVVAARPGPAPIIGSDRATIEIVLGNATLRLVGDVSPGTLNTVLDCLAGRP